MCIIVVSAVADDRAASVWQPALALIAHVAAGCDGFHWPSRQCGPAAVMASTARAVNGRDVASIVQSPRAAGSPRWLQLLLHPLPSIAHVAYGPSQLLASIL